jgi:hypothetical protein
MKDYLLAHGVPVDDIPLTPMTAQKILSGVYFSEDDFEFITSIAGGGFGRVFVARIKKPRNGYYNGGEFVAIQLETCRAKDLFRFHRTIVDGCSVVDEGIAEVFADFVFDARYDGNIDSNRNYVTFAMVQELGATTLTLEISSIHARRAAAEKKKRRCCVAKRDEMDLGIYTRPHGDRRGYQRQWGDPP